ncbi:SDR family oxidoreductase [Rhodospirillum rubrum]|uniref:Short-chain dehydrogenase/reductase SDR n=1 Tax=Rhodospirillum rubrum (strain ATCC 11170 / ATH 1.1.1 / DSM 467 / LMG 4362 / NCIMB 8255 / S1) TaxID=269796 RepID=Q2RT00_RHORT|nr:SDR family oxidoreductase [Rhodospirillum rubrum]ABC22745.1 Short-chain dehydrogenase/reductase SDR [Rhodospirillum rubrum ATCC 11170]AEO48465.1 short-chain dehydrogenase/reductase sDR [Rhodospirillum rubrum F11]MBK5954342.1 short-chain dehydrogenase [Rhodospirillum rubrum]QXG78737.1 SDR family oxidoreductase [Rhodospirillum rubrum]HAP99603.1 short-chain dehydrogenase [Rhodospirillum rubrum]
MSTILISGANRGLGLEFARQYRQEGHRVIGTCRDPGKAGDLLALGAEVLPLDVADLAAVAGFGAVVGDQPVDLFINNAGVYGGRHSEQDLGEVDSRVWLETLVVNTIAPLKLTEAILPNLERAEAAKAVYLSSKMGSMAANSAGGAYIYRSSKAALNAVVRSLAADLADRAIVVAALHPGWVRTDMGGPDGDIDAGESIAGLRRVIAALATTDSGRFLAYDGGEVPW